MTDAITTNPITNQLLADDALDQHLKTAGDNGFEEGVIFACARIVELGGAHSLAQSVLEQSDIDYLAVCPRVAEYDLRFLRTQGLDLPLGCDFGDEYPATSAPKQWIHPSSPIWWDEATPAEEYKQWYASHGIEIKTRWMAEDSAELDDRYAAGDMSCLDEWAPTSPGGDYFIWAIYETEDGVICEWARRVIEADRNGDA